ncbi:MAG TPA: isoprenyl transferase [Candidatus Caccomonas pullistercoris]|nr:isoprenyl transferase [Candidatus Caccomonas pullistercoris]
MLDKAHIPAHVAIIMDGNGRWAKARGLSRSMGHQQGVETVKRITEEATRLGIKYLTLYTFSTENWRRPADEIAALMALILDSLEEEIFMRNNVRFRVIGDTGRLPAPVRERLSLCEKRTAANDRMTMVVALSYSSRWELTEACRSIASETVKAMEKTGSAPEITEATIESHLTTSFMPDPDLLIRTGGELRLSNYLLWQCAYTELYFCDTYWPDFDEEAFRAAIEEYQHRQRRYGQTGDQVEQQSEQFS